MKTLALLLLFISPAFAANPVPSYTRQMDAPRQSAVSVAASTTVIPGVSIDVTATTAGTITLTMADGSTLVHTIQIGSTILPLAVTQWVAGTAVVTAFYNLN